MGEPVFVLEVDTQRLLRIDSLSLEVQVFAAGLAPMDLAIIGAREQSLLLDAHDLIEVLDHRQSPPASAAWTTARALSHLAVSPSGDHVVAYFDWDDTRAQQRQPEPGNINQVSVLYVGNANEAMADGDGRLRSVAVGFLPRDVRFAADGSRAVVVSRDTLTPIELSADVGDVALPRAQVSFDGSAAEILIDSLASVAVMRFADSTQIDLIPLDGSAKACFETPKPVTDIILANDGRLLIVSGDAEGHELTRVDRSSASAPCTAVGPDVSLGSTSRLAVDPSGNMAVAYHPDIQTETVALVAIDTLSATSVVLEKAVGAVAFAGDGEHALLSHLKTDGAPAWNPAVEDPELSVDKSYGVSWLHMGSVAHRLAVSDQPFGAFAFVPATDTELGATFATILDERVPQVLRVTHRPGFDDAWIDLAAVPRKAGFLPETGRIYVTQSHPWGRVTFIDPVDHNLRHVTGFALDSE